MTYRRDSDIWAPYARFVPLSNQTTSTSSLNRTKGAWKDKTGWVAWVVSRCFTHSRREEYVNLLKKHIPVDVFGRCGSKLCDSDCFDRIAKDYRFYISIENSLCTDYVTEKFFSRMNDFDAILIVLQPNNSLGGGYDNYAKIAPENSFIDATKFESPEALAQYLKQVGNNEDEFRSFFQWRKKYSISRADFQPFCDLCKKLHEDDLPRKSYSDIREWWVGGTKPDISTSKAHCHAGAHYGSKGQRQFPAFNVPYFIHIMGS